MARREPITTGEQITLASSRHARGAGGIAPERLTRASNESPAPFQQEGGGHPVRKSAGSGFAGEAQPDLAQDD